MKSVIVTGAAGFVGYHLTKSLSDAGYQIYAIVRPGSEHNGRIAPLSNVTCIECDLDNESADRIKVLLSERILNQCDYFFHLVWKPADRYDYSRQMESGYLTFRMLELAAALGCRRFIGIGSQAEYGAVIGLITEDDTVTKPFCGYGAAKVAACEYTRRRAKELGMEWVWGRIFSIYGKYEPESRLLPSLLRSFSQNEEIHLSSCQQMWDFLYGSDAGKAILAMAEQGHNGEIYNVADGNCRTLKEYVEIVRSLCNSHSKVIYGDDPIPFVSLNPSMKKLMQDTGWKPEVAFEDGIKELINE